jgi:hypothetical protein
MLGKFKPYFNKKMAPPVLQFLCKINAPEVPKVPF